MHDQLYRNFVAQYFPKEIILKMKNIFEELSLE